MKKILTIQDISCYGKCSITTALPILSSMGIETVILPTAVLSTHTMFQDFTVKDLTDQLIPITEHWKSQGIKFDGIYTGYLGSFEQIALMHRLIAEFRGPSTKVIVDPCMADNGKLYPAFDTAYAALNAGLCEGVDIIVPNITEACFMTGTEYRETYDEGYIKELLGKLTELGAGITVLTGVSLEEGMTGVMGYDRGADEYYSYQNRRIDAVYHGTGDLFSSTAIGEIMKGADWKNAMRIAADYTARTIEVTLENPEKPWYGVDFETTLPELMKME